MKFPRIYTLKEISELIDSEYIGDDTFSVFGMNEIHVVEQGDIVFVDHPKYYDKALNSEATVVLINKKVQCPKGKALLISDDPFRDFNKLSTYFNPFQSAKKSVANSSNIGINTIIQPNVFIGNNVTIGNNCRIHSNVSIYDNCTIGNNVIVHAGTILGADAFYYKNREEGYDRLISCGSVVIEDDVEIGAGCTIDRGVTGQTTIKKGSKLDNQIQVGHDSVIGKKCLIAAQVGIAGCCIIEDEVIIWGQVGMTSGVTVGKGAVILGQTGVSKSVEGGKSYFGTPITESRQMLKELAMLKRLTKEKK